MALVNIDEIRLHPKAPLARRGCEIESCTREGELNFFTNTHFQKVFKEKENTFKIQKYLELIDFIKNNYINYVSILRKIELKEQDKIDSFVEKLIEYKVIKKDLTKSYSMEKIGNLFECLVSRSLNEMNISSARDIKIKYPYPENPYDPDGQKYDVIGTLDISKFLWIECKKPLYLNEKNPLNNVIDKNRIQKFIRRAHFLRPSIAIYLVDTKDDYRESLKKIFSIDLLKSGLMTIFPSSQSQIMARLNGFIYFNRVTYNDNSKFIESLKMSVNQVLHDARNEHVVQSIFPNI